MHLLPSIRSLAVFFALEFALVAIVLLLGQSWILFGALSVVLVIATLLYDSWDRMEPIHLIAFGVALTLVGIIWIMLRPSTPSATVEQVATLQADFDKYVKPRTLTDEQVRAIADYLLPRGPHKILIIFNYPDSEASNYAGQLSHAFRTANWEVSMEDGPGGKTRSGLLMVEGAAINMKAPPKGTPKARQLIDEAFRIAKVPISGGATEYTPDENAEPFIFITVGPRPKQIQVSEDN